MTEPGQPCPVCGYPDPAHQWDVHEQTPVQWTGPAETGVRFTVGGDDGQSVQELRGASTMLARSSTRGGRKVRWLAVHSTEGIMKAPDLRAWKSWPGSSHASADADGVLLSGGADGFVPYERAAWTLRNGNPVSENIELCAWARWTRAEWLSRPLLLERCAEWLADRHKVTGVPLVKLTVAQVRAGHAGVIDHDDYSDATGDGTHHDVGESFPWDIAIPRARLLAGETDPEDDDMTPAQLDELVDRVAAKVVSDLKRTDVSPAAGTQDLANTLSQTLTGVRELLDRVPATTPEP